MGELHTRWRRQLQCTTALYSLLWLLAANLVGLWLAILLIWPGAGEWMGVFSYGRWMPLHMDWQLYGWCSLPLVGLLIGYYLKPGESGEVHLGFLAWSIGLAVAGVMSLHGVVSGKLFLNHAGVARIAFPVGQVLLWVILMRASWARWRSLGRIDLKQGLQGGLLAGLIVSPFALFWSAGGAVYPPIDPQSGGATGHSLLASSLGIIFIFGCLPKLLSVARCGSGAAWFGTSSVYWAAYVLSWGAWALLNHGNESNTQLGQILGMSVLLLWIPLIIGYFRSYDWPSGLKPWLYAFLFWWGLLTVTGFISFLPGVLDLMKFTNGLVAHAHLAMAGMLGAINMLILGTLGRAEAGDPWVDRVSFWLWQGGTLLYVLAMMIEGVREGLDPTVLIGANAVTTFFYGLRLLAGVFLVVANLRWIMCLEQLRVGKQSKQATAEGDATYAI